MNTALLLDRAAAAPDRTAVYLGARPLHRYRELRDRVAAPAVALSSHGCALGDRIAVFMANRPQYLEVLFAAWWAGLAVVPINSQAWR